MIKNPTQNLKVFLIEISGKYLTHPAEKKAAIYRDLFSTAVTAFNLSQCKNKEMNGTADTVSIVNTLNLK